MKEKDQRAWLSISDCQRGEHLACGITGDVSLVLTLSVLVFQMSFPGGGLLR